MKSQPKMQFILQKDWTAFSVEQFCRYFDRLVMESVDRPESVLLVLNRSNHRHISRILQKIEKSGRLMPLKIAICRDTLWQEYMRKHGQAS